MTMTITHTARRAAPRTATLVRAAALLVGVLLVALALVLLGHEDVTKPRLETSLNPAFNNLYVKQQEILGHPGVTPAGMRTTSTCDRGGPSVPDEGAGPDWICLVDFVDSTGAPQEGKFELQVHANSCYTAGAPAKLLGSFTITDTSGVEVPNPVNAFDVCFDPDA
jgi:hypothetical protein